MLEENIDTLEHLEDDNKNIEIEDKVIDNEKQEDINESNQDSTDELDENNQTDSNDNNSENKETDLNSLSDDEFLEFLESGKLLNKDSKKDSSTPKEIQKEEITEKEKNEVISKDNKDNIDYKSIYENIFKGFKANGKEIKPRNIDDVISLMQMGANYTKKMQTVAPMKRTIESLNKANINENDLNFLIDIHNGNKDAIKKLLEKHKVDPMELDMDNTNYVPNNNMLSSEDIEYSNILEDIQSSLPKIQEIITKQWDAKSKQRLLADPNLLKALHEEIENGRFDEVQNRLELEKTFGRYKDKADIDAYIDLVSKIVTEKQEKATGTSNKPANTPKKEIPDKKSAAPNKAIKQNSHNQQLSAKSVFSMSDEDFAKLCISDLV